MATRLPASRRTREELTALIEGRLSTVSAKDQLVKLATRLIVEEALEGEAGDAIGRDYYEHGAQPGQGYRNGYRTGRLKTAEGLMEYSAPQVAGRDEPFRSAVREHLRGHTQGLEDLAIEMLARGLRFATSRMRSRTRMGAFCCRGPRCRSLASACGRITRRSPSET
jgi:transposase-like protein